MASGQLASFAVKNVHGLDTGEKKGSGAYGAVYKVTIDGVPCIAKRLHDILVDPEVPRKQRDSIQEKFHNECVLLSQLRHPNLVHFVGVHYGSNQDDISLIMECLDTDLARYLETQPNIPIEVKLLILLDVSYGLLYLHTHSPQQIIHRDLTATNILLTRDKRAKLADLGVSKLLDPRAQAAMMQTKAPGTHYYMPPEALMENPKYDEKLDIFSFGHLALFVINQVFPEVFEVSITPVMLCEETLQIVRRQKAIDEMGKDHCLHDIVLKSLQDNPQKQPTTLKLNEMLNHLCMKHPRERDVTEEENRKLSMDVEALQRDKKSLEKTMHAIDARNEELESSAQQLQARLKEMEQKEEWARKQLESVTESSRKTYQTCHELQEENKQLSEQFKKQSRLNDDHVTLLNVLKAQVRRVEQEKEALQNEVQIAKTEAESERHGREEAHKKIASLASQDAERLETERLQMQEQYRMVLAKLEGCNKELKQYKEQVDTLKDELAELKLVNAQSNGGRKAKKDASRSQKVTKKKLSDTGITSPEPTGMYKEGNRTLRSKLFSIPRTRHLSLGRQQSNKAVKKDEETEQEEIPPHHLDEQPLIHTPSTLSLSNPEVPSPPSSPKTRNRPQGQQTPENTYRSHIPDPPQQQTS